MVSGITEEDVHSMFEMRLLVEPYALRTYGNLIPREQLEAYHRARCTTPSGSTTSANPMIDSTSC